MRLAMRFDERVEGWPPWGLLGGWTVPVGPVPRPQSGGVAPVVRRCDVSVWVQVLGAVALGLSLVEKLPQAARVLSDPSHTHGVSPVAWSVMVVNQVAWAWWAVGRSDWWLLAASSVPLLSASVVLASMWRARRVRRGLLALLPVVVLVVVSLPTWALGAAAVVLGTAPALVQLRRVWREGAEGVSAATWWLTAARTTCWMAYAVAMRDPVNFAPGPVLLPASVALALRSRRR